MLKLRNGIFVLVLAAMMFIQGCSKQDKQNNQTQTDKKEIGWKDGVSANDIPDSPLKATLGGKEIQFAYVCFEKWRGSGDNVLVFSLNKPSQPCGFIEDFQGVVLTSKGAPINQGELTKSKFGDDPKNLTASFSLAGQDKFSGAWDCSLVIESIDTKSVKGRIALYFNDDKKSQAAGKFEASICNN